MLARRRLYSQLSKTLTPTAKKQPAAVTSKVWVEKQAPNRTLPWSVNQRSREGAMSGARFEQVDLSMQPQPPAAIEMINAQPIIKVESRTAVCDGGGGPLGHPKVYINLDRDGANVCKYCGLRFEQGGHHHH
eukprot:Partr_v1_DN27408_c2_g1_i5_m72373 putative NADH dehydrogenase (ubiquinone) Fe-S protein 6